MLNKAHQGYIYQDILGAYFVAQELAHGRLETEFLFDLKKTPSETLDKFDDIYIKRTVGDTLIQVKYSNDSTNHILTKSDFSSASTYDLFLADLFKTWKALKKQSTIWKVLLAWQVPATNDKINDVLIEDINANKMFPSTRTYKFDCDVLWPEMDQVISSWRSLKKESTSIDRSEFKEFLSNLSIELECPKSNLLENFDNGIELLLSSTISRIGIGEYPNDFLTIRQVAESLCTIVQRQRAKDNQELISAQTIATEIGIKTTFGGIEQKFPIDKNVLVDTPNRVGQVVELLQKKQSVILTAEPGAGKSWFIENLEKYFEENESHEKEVIKHYCYTALNDPLVTDRITTNVLYGSLITQITNYDSDLRRYMTKRYASNLEELNILLGQIKKDTLLIIDGIDHVWRVYQKNRGGMTEGQTSIIEALSKLELSNPNVSLLILSQPVIVLDDLPQNFHRSTLSKVSEGFVQGLLNKNRVPNTNSNDKLISKIVHEKSTGNALYCKYLIDHLKSNTNETSIAELPEYDFNLNKYYNYLYEQVESQSAIPYALCGADFSLTELELKEITQYGDMVSEQLNQLRPLLRYNSAVGYSIYHESFKRFIMECIKKQNASVIALVYSPIISWLESLPFYESSKAYGHLLKLYFEIDKKDKIAQTIGPDFLKESLYNAHPIGNIINNHLLQKTSLCNSRGFEAMIIISEQSRIIYELESLEELTLIAYLDAIQVIHGNDYMYRVLWDGEQLLINHETALTFLADQACKKSDEIHWNIIPESDFITYKLLGATCIRYLHQKEYDRFDEFVQQINEESEQKSALQLIGKDIEWWMIFNGREWLAFAPYYNKLLLDETKTTVTPIETLIEIVMQEKFHYDENWEEIINKLIHSYIQSSVEKQEEVIVKLSNYNWFRNWVIFILKVSDLARRNYHQPEIVNAFSFLVRDLEPFKGTPRTCDLYKQREFIELSFYKGLLLCNGDEHVINECCELLEKVIGLTTSIQGSFSGPLVEEKFLKIISFFLPIDKAYKKHTEYYSSLSSSRVYSAVAENAFQCCKVLNSFGRKKEALDKYKEGIQALTAYGYRKDRTFSEILYAAVPFQKAYSTLSIDWFYELNKLAWSAATHTDGKGTRTYPIEWFGEFTKVYPQEALKFLTYETYENKMAHWYQEESFTNLLEEHPCLFTPTQWFLLCRTVPLLNSEKIISYGLSIIDQVESSIREVFFQWLQALPFTEKDKDKPQYSFELNARFKEVFDIELKCQKKSSNRMPSTDQVKEGDDFPKCSLDKGLAILEENIVTKDQSKGFRNFIEEITDPNEKNKAIRLFVKRISRATSETDHDWVNDLFQSESHESIYLNICLFVYLTDGWFHVMCKTEYFEKVYAVNPEKSISILKEVLSIYISDSQYQPQISGNLIKTLSRVNIDEEICRPLMELVHQLVKDRLPNPPSLRTNFSIKEGLTNLNEDEIAVSLMIARLKTLTVEKTQSIIWGLTYIAQQNPEYLIKPITWALTNRDQLLPLHRVLLIQILRTHIHIELIPDELINLLLNNYPTGYFLEDQHVRSLLEYNIELDETTPPSILFPPSEHDDIPIFANSKYYNLHKKLGGLTGSFGSYEIKRDQISKEYDGYFLRAENLMTPIVPLANAMYEVINSNFYKQLKEITEFYGEEYTCQLDIKTPEVILQSGAISLRPSQLPFPSNFPVYSSTSSHITIKNDEWIIIASKEQEIVGEHFGEKRTVFSNRTIFFGELPSLKSYVYSNYEFSTDLYFGSFIKTAPIDNAISCLSIKDTMEQSDIVYLTPWVIRELNLNVSHNFHNGFIAYDSEQNEIVKLVKWKEKYVGDMGNSTEVPTLSGVAVMIKDSWYEKLLSLAEKSVYIESSDSNDAI